MTDESGNKTAGGKDTCWLCGRALGTRVEKHHIVPKLLGGRETRAMHPICHRKIHATFSERELTGVLATAKGLQAHPDIARFIKWVRKKPPDFHSRTVRPNHRRR